MRCECNERLSQLKERAAPLIFPLLGALNAIVTTPLHPGIKEIIWKQVVFNYIKAYRQASCSLFSSIIHARAHRLCTCWTAESQSSFKSLNCSWLNFLLYWIFCMRQGKGLTDLQVHFCGWYVSLETRQKVSDYSASLVVIADSVHHMFIYTEREKEGQCVSVDLPGDLLFRVLTWILWYTGLQHLFDSPHARCTMAPLSGPHPSPSTTLVPDVSAASLGHRGWATWPCVCVFVHMCVCVQQILYVTDPLVWDDAVFTAPPLSKSSNGEKVSVIPSPDQILLFNPRLWTFGLASRSGPGAGGWWAHREASCWAGRFSGADRQEAAQKLWWPAFASICCSGSPTRTAWCRGLRLWIGPLGHPFWLTHWVWDAFSFFHSFIILQLVYAAFLFPFTLFFLPVFHCFNSFLPSVDPFFCCFLIIHAQSKIAQVSFQLICIMRNNEHTTNNKHTPCNTVQHIRYTCLTDSCKLTD